MKFTAQLVPLSTGKHNIVVLRPSDCFDLDFHEGTRLELTYKKKKVIAALDIGKGHILEPNTIGLFDEVTKALGAKTGATIHVQEVQRPKSLLYIKKKLSGKKLLKHELEAIVKDISSNTLTDVEITYFVAGCYSFGLTLQETTYLTQAIVNVGSQLSLAKKKILDKHCIGGVPGNRTTMIIVPIIAAAGFTIPKTSSRSITSPAGTADTMEVLANVQLQLRTIKKVIKKTNGCIVWGGTLNLAPADDKIIDVEHPLAIDAVGMLLSSVLAKKKSVGATHLIIDIPFGPGAKIESKQEAKHLKRQFQVLCKRLGIKVKVVLTDGKQPVGRGIGPLLEAIDVLKVLKREQDAPLDLREKSLLLAGDLLELAGVKDGFLKAQAILDSGKAYEKFIQISTLQGKKQLPPTARYEHSFEAWKPGRVKALDNKAITRMALVCGAPQIKQAGAYLHKKIGESVVKGSTLLTIYSNNKNAIKYAKTFFKKNNTYVIR